MIRKFECKNCHKVFQADDQNLVICPECHSDNVEYYSIHIPYKKIIAVIAALTATGIGIFYFLNKNSHISSNNDDNDISPVDSPDSQRLIGRILIRAKRPVPECEILSASGGTALPVRMNCPSPPP